MRLKIPAAILALSIGTLAFRTEEVRMTVSRSSTLDSLGACQGISYQKGKAFLYGDREVGLIREYRVERDSLVYLGRETKLTQAGKDVINHPTGIAYHGTDPTFIGNSIRL
ncbi:MAG: hypothetical protein H7Z75_17155, partial [Ferruginibacter sp.]|nr:hypothetical protein [Cytophagales bacterium]